jgi:hypothetical protein
MSKGSSSPAPDYTAAAQTTAAGNAANLAAQTAANRPDQYTPWGSSTWTQTPGADGTTSWTNNVTLSPAEQAALTAQQQIQQNQSSLAQTMQGQVASTMKDGFQAPTMSSYLGGVPSTNTSFSGFSPTGVNGVNQSYINPSAYTSAYQGINQNFSSGAKQNTQFTSNTPALNNSLQTGANAVNQNFTSSANPLQSSAAGSQVNTDLGVSTAAAGSVNLNAPQFDQSTADAGTKAAYSASTGLLTDQWQQDNKNLDSQLRMQGLTPGTEAYNNAMQNQLRVQGQQQDQLANQAVITGNQLANTNYASSLAGYQAGNAAQNQAYTQGVNNFTTTNAALGQQFNQNISNAQLANSASGQQFSQDLQGFNENNAAQQQQYTQGLSTANFNNTATNQQYQNNLAAYTAQNAASNTQYQNDLAGFNANNAAATQSLQNGLAQYSAALQGQSAYNTAAGQAYNQALGTYGVNSQAQINSNAAQSQSYQQAMQQYQTAYQSAYQNYLQPLNSMNAVLTGQQVSAPTMPGFTAAGYTPGTDYTSAASATGQYNSGVAAQNAASTSSTLGTIGSLGAAAIMAY